MSIKHPEWRGMAAHTASYELAFLKLQERRERPSSFYAKNIALPIADDYDALYVWDSMIHRRRDGLDYSTLLREFAAYAVDTWGLIVCGPDGVAIGA